MGAFAARIKTEHMEIVPLRAKYSAWLRSRTSEEFDIPRLLLYIYIVSGKHV